MQVLIDNGENIPTYVYGVHLALGGEVVDHGA